MNNSWKVGLRIYFFKFRAFDDPGYFLIFKTNF